MGPPPPGEQRSTTATVELHQQHQQQEIKQKHCDREEQQEGRQQQKQPSDADSNGKTTTTSDTSNDDSYTKMDPPGNDFPAGMRVLVVDDDRTCLVILEKMLRRCAYQGTCVYCMLHISIYIHNLLLPSLPRIF
jgi:hypothetical protein